MPMFLTIVVLLAAHYGEVLCILDIDQICHLTDPSIRKSLLKSATDQLQETYHSRNGLSIAGICDPRDPGIPPSCANYNNPSVAYGSFLVPCPDNKCPPETPSAAIPGKSGYYQPRQDDALILFGCLPPETQYFGIRSYLYEKAKSNIHDDVDCSDAMSSPTGKDIEVFPPKPTVPETRVVVDSPWYDTRNQLSLNAVGKPGSSTKFGSLFVHITTANKQVATDVAEAFVKMGVPSKALNIDSIPDLPLFDLNGNASVRDSFRTIYRLVVPKSFVSTTDEPPPASEDDFDKYIDIKNQNILVRYLTPKSPIPKNGFLPRVPTTRSTGERESDLVGKLAFQILLSSVKAHYGEPDYVSEPVPIVINMWKCLQGCYGFGDNEDTVYINTDKSVSIGGQGDFAVVCGANHILLKYAVYTSVGVYNTSGLAVGLVTDEMKQNSAHCFMPRHPHVDKFYCVEIRSDCMGSPYCVQPIFGDITTVLVQYRVNLNPRTHTGPDVNEIIWPMVFGYRNNRKQFPVCKKDVFENKTRPRMQEKKKN